MFYCKKKFRVLKQSLEEIENQGLLLYHQRLTDLRSRLKFNRHDFDLRLQMIQLERQMETRIREVFLRFMCACFYGYEQYLRPIRRKPNQTSTDAAVLFEFDNFLRSRDSSYAKFYTLLLHTQMFSRFIEERSFLSSSTLNQSILITENHHNYSLVFFDECCSKVRRSIETNEQQVCSLVDTSDMRTNDRNVKTTIVLSEFLDGNHSASSNGYNDLNLKTNRLISNGGNKTTLQEPSSMNTLRVSQDKLGTGKLIPNSPMVKRSRLERDKCQKVTDFSPQAKQRNIHLCLK